LSLERAEASLAILRQKVDDWYGWYSPGTAVEKRWGAREDAYMIGAIAAAQKETIPPGLSPVRWFQGSRGLSVDGVAGPATRRAFILEYMRLAGTALASSVRADAHGCGENFPRDLPGNQADRYVEAFLFESPIAPAGSLSAILPPPPGKNSRAGSRVYPEWLLRVQETLRHAVPTSRLEVALRIAWEAGFVGMVPEDMAFELDTDSGETLTLRWSDAVPREGYVELAFPGVYHDVRTRLSVLIGESRYELWKDEVLDRDHGSIAWIHTLGDLLIAGVQPRDEEGTPMGELPDVLQTIWSPEDEGSESEPDES
jgi:hypothetical protein